MLFSLILQTFIWYLLLLDFSNFQNYISQFEFFGGVIQSPKFYKILELNNQPINFAQSQVINLIKLSITCIESIYTQKPRSPSTDHRPLHGRRRRRRRRRGPPSGRHGGDGGDAGDGDVQLRHSLRSRSAGSMPAYDQSDGLRL